MPLPWIEGTKGKTLVPAEKNFHLRKWLRPSAAVERRLNLAWFFKKYAR
jgi:hypothetical protein